MKALLISENTEEAITIKKMFKANFPKIEVIIAYGPEEAMDHACTNGPYVLYMLDVDSKEVDTNALGLNLLDFTGPRPIIFLGTESIFKDIIKDELFNSNEFNTPLYRPLAADSFVGEFKSKIEKILSWVKQEEFAQNLVEMDPKDYIEMKLKFFYLYDKFDFDVYMSITPRCFIKVITADIKYPQSLLVNYSKKNVKYLYIKKDDQIKFIEEETKKCLKTLTQIKPNSPDIYLVLLKSISLTHQYLLTIGITDEVTKLIDIIIIKVIDHINKVVSLKEIIRKYPQFYQGTASKSLLTAILVNFLSDKMGWESISTKKKLIVSSILQDIYLEDDVYSKVSFKTSPILDGLDEETVDLFLSHPQQAAQLAKNFNSFPDIDHIVLNHHELPSRNGFPTRPTNSHLTKINAVFNIAQYIAAEFDGEKINKVLINKTIHSMVDDFNIGIFKDPLSMVQKLLKF